MAAAKSPTSAAPPTSGPIPLTPANILRVYMVLTALNTLAASFIWGINTLFLLDAGLNNAQAFAANAFFTVGEVLFEVPTGVIADFRGRRFSFLMGSLTLFVSTLLYLWMWRIHGPMWGWALSSITLGLGFTFFSGATEAWLVDALDATGFKGDLDSVFAKGQVVTGAAMLIGTVSGGWLAQEFNLGVPYLLRSGVLVAAFLAAFFLMKDLGFEPERGVSPAEKIKGILRSSVQYGFRRPSVRWIMLSAPFTYGVTFYAFYALQPHLLKLYGNEKAFGVAGVIAAVLAAAQISGGLLAPWARRLLRKRSTFLLAGQILGSLLLIIFALVGDSVTMGHFAAALALVVLWALASATLTPVRQSYLNALIPSKQRATVLSLDSLMGATGGVIFQPPLGRVADVAGYPASFMVCGAINALSWPFLYLARRENEPTDSLSAPAADPNGGPGLS